MTALSVIGANLINSSMVPLSIASGAQSESDPNSGLPETPVASIPEPVTTGDRAGAAILTILVAVFSVGGAFWLVWD